MSVVDLSGRLIVDKVQDNNIILTLLKRLVAEIESGERSVEDFYLIAESEAGKKTSSFDNGLTVMQAVMMLEREKFRILCATEGVKL